MIAAGDGILSFIASVATNGVGSAVAQALTDEPKELKSGDLKDLPEKASGKIAEAPDAASAKSLPKPDGTVQSAKRLAPTVQGYLADARKEIKNATARQKAIDYIKDAYPIEQLNDSAKQFATVMQNPDTSIKAINEKKMAPKVFHNFIEKYDADVQKLIAFKKHVGDPEGKLQLLINERLNQLNEFRKLYMKFVGDGKPKTSGQPNGSSVPTGRTPHARKGDSKRVSVTYGSFDIKDL